MISVVVPTYNERQNIAELVERAGKTLAATGEDYELIIVDDQSSDGTPEEVRRLQTGRPWLRLLVRKGERELSTAVLAGWRIAAGDIWGCMDGDLQHPPEHLAKLVERLRSTKADVVIASRYVEQGGVNEWNFVRRSISWTATTLAAILLPSRLRRVRDPMSGFFILNRWVVDGVRLKPLGYKILLEVLARGRYSRPEEVPYVFEERGWGHSKMGSVQVWHYFLQLFRLCYETGEAWRFLRSALGAVLVIVLGVAGLLWLYVSRRLGLTLAALLSGEAALLTHFFLAGLFGPAERAAWKSRFLGRFWRLQLRALPGLAANLGVVLVGFRLLRLPLFAAGLTGSVVGTILFLVRNSGRLPSRDREEFAARI